MLLRARKGHRIDTSSALQHLRSLGTIVLGGPFDLGASSTIYSYVSLCCNIHGFGLQIVAPTLHEKTAILQERTSNFTGKSCNFTGTNLQLYRNKLQLYMKQTSNLQEQTATLQETNSNFTGKM